MRAPTSIGPGRRAARALGDRRAYPNRRWLSALLALPVDRLDAFLSEADRFAELEHGIRERQIAGGRRSYAQFRAPLELYAMVRALRPDHVIETGVSSGVSSAHILLALRRNRRGTLHSIDFPTAQRGARFSRRDSPVALPPGRRTGWVVPPELRRGWDLRIGPSEKLLVPLVAETPTVGLFLHDSRHTPRHLAFELDTIAPRLEPGSIVLADNTVWTGRASPRFARRLGASVRRRGRSDLVGLRVPPGVLPPPRGAGGR